MSERNGGIPDPIVWLGCVLTAVAVSVLIQSLRSATPRDASEESLAMRRALDQTDRIVEQLDRLDERIRSLEDGASRGFGYVTFTDNEEASRALAKPGRGARRQSSITSGPSPTTAISARRGMSSKTMASA